MSELRPRPGKGGSKEKRSKSAKKKAAAEAEAAAAAAAAQSRAERRYNEALNRLAAEEKRRPKLPPIRHSANTREWRVIVMGLLRECRVWVDKAREHKELEVLRQNKSKKQYWEDVEKWRLKIKAAYEKGISLLKAALAMRPRTLDEEGREISTKLVHKIIQLYSASLDNVEARDEMPTTTPAFEWLMAMYKEYENERKKICGQDSTLDNPFGFKFTQEEAPSHPDKWIWKCLNPHVVNVRGRFRDLLLTRYPYMHTICEEIARAYSSENDFKPATRYASHAVQIVTEITPEDFKGQLDAWHYTKKLHASQRLSSRSYREFIKWQLALREPYMPSGAPLMYAMLSQQRKLADNRVEKLGNILLVYSGYLAVIAGIILAVYSSSCQGQPQEVIVDANTFAGNADNPVFTEVSRFPACAADCQDESQATCTDYDCPCIDIGCTCFCENPMFDSCSGLGVLRRGMRNNMYLVYFFVSVLEMAILIIALGVVGWPSVPVETEALRESFKLDRFHLLEDSCILIASHGPPTAIKKSVAAALKIFRPDQIFVCHNGPAKFPNDDGQTRQFCEDVITENFPGCKLKIQYQWISEPNKTMALYMTALRRCKFQYIMITDNDVMLPEDIYIPIHRFDEKVKALCFTIRAENLANADGSLNWLTCMQDLEYKKAGLTKMLQSKLGTTFYAHGAIAMWDRDIMLEVLGRHNTMFHGEDLQMGYIMHMMNKDYRMKTVGQVSVPTTVPNHLVCYPFHYDDRKSPFVRAFAAPFNCEHEEKSLFQQRAKSWDAAAHRVVILFANMFVFVWTRGVLALKPFLIYEIWSVIQDYLRFPFAILILMQPDKVVSFLIGVFVIYWSQVGLLYVMNYWTFRHRRDLRSEPRYIALFPAYNSMLLLFRLAALMYNALVYLPLERNKTKIKNRTYLPSILAYKDGAYVQVTQPVDSDSEDEDESDSEDESESDDDDWDSQGSEDDSDGQARSDDSAWESSDGEDF